jgi:hypothetical protein
VQKRELRKNYIGVLSDRFEEQCAAELQVKSDQRVKGYFLRLMSAVRSPRADAG